MRARLSPSSFESLLIDPIRVKRQRDAATGCGPACVEMVWEMEREITGEPESAQAARCASLSINACDRRSAWATRPDVLCAALNASCPAGNRMRPGILRYHLVHGALPHGPLDEVLSWLSGPQLASQRLPLPSILLTRFGTHWMLAVGARVESDCLSWLAVADPGTGRLQGLTSEGVDSVFTPNRFGDHPDWTSRYVVVVPSVLPRLSSAGVGGGNLMPRPQAQKSQAQPGVEDVRPVFESPRWRWPEDEAAGPLERLRRMAEDSVNPRVSGWLAPLKHAFGILGTGASDCVARRRVWAVDGNDRPVAELLVSGRPATVLHFVPLA